MKITSIIFFLIIASSYVNAQYNDARLWLGLNVEKKINPKVSLLLNETVRMVENYTQVGTVFTDIGARYRLGKNWRFGAHYRFSKRRNDKYEEYANGHRLYFDVIYKRKTTTPLSFNIRARYQMQYVDFFTSRKGRIPSDHFRLKGTLSYDLDKRYKPYIGIEFFYRLKYGESKFDNSRYYAGFVYDIDKQKSIDIHYMLIRSINSKNPTRYYVLSLNYYYSF